MSMDSEFQGWKNEGGLRAVFIDAKGNVKTASPEKTERDYWHHIALENGHDVTGHAPVLTKEEARVALSCLDLSHG